MSVVKMKENNVFKGGLLVENPVYKPFNIHGVMMHG